MASAHPAPPPGTPCARPPSPPAGAREDQGGGIGDPLVGLSSYQGEGAGAGRDGRLEGVGAGEGEGAAEGMCDCPTGKE